METRAGDPGAFASVFQQTPNALFGLALDLQIFRGFGSSVRKDFVVPLCA